MSLERSSKVPSHADASIATPGSSSPGLTPRVPPRQPLAMPIQSLRARPSSPRAEPDGVSPTLSVTQPSPR